MNKSICVSCGEPFLAKGIGNQCDVCINNIIYKTMFSKRHEMLFEKAQITCSDAVAKVQPIRNDDLESAAGFMEGIEIQTEAVTRLMKRNEQLEEKIMAMENAGDGMSKWIDVEVDSESNQAIGLIKQWNKAKKL